MTYNNLTKEISVLENDKAFEATVNVTVKGTVYKMGIPVLNKKQWFVINIYPPLNYFAPVLTEKLQNFMIEMNSS